MNSIHIIDKGEENNFSQQSYSQYWFSCTDWLKFGEPVPAHAAVFPEICNHISHNLCNQLYVQTTQSTLGKI